VFLYNRRQTEAFHAKLQQRKELYEEVYNEVREGCELTASSEVLEALQREAQQVTACGDVLALIFDVLFLVGSLLSEFPPQ